MEGNFSGKRLFPNFLSPEKSAEISEMEKIHNSVFPERDVDRGYIGIPLWHKNAVAKPLDHYRRCRALVGWVRVKMEGRG